jgi:hypothetical protein
MASVTPRIDVSENKTAIWLAMAVTSASFLS